VWPESFKSRPVALPQAQVPAALPAAITTPKAKDLLARNCMAFPSETDDFEPRRH